MDAIKEYDNTEETPDFQESIPTGGSQEHNNNPEDEEISVQESILSGGSQEHDNSEAEE